MRVTKAPDETMTVKVEDANLEQVHQFKNLDIQITVDARSATELEYRMIIVREKFSSMTNVLK